MESPLVSVIVVSYNHSRFVEECLNSLLNQTYKNWELIVADDASRDNSVDVINNWLRDNKIKAKIVFHTKNTGLCTILNECVLLTKGKYVKIIAADDVMSPNLFENGIQRFKKLPQSYKLVYANAKFVDENGKMGDKLARDNFDFNRDNLEESLFKGNFIIALTVMMKQDIFSLIGDFNANFVIEDYEFWLRLSKQYKIDYIDEVLGLYRWHSDNITKKIDMEEEVVRIKILNDSDNKYSRIIADNILTLYKENRISNKLIESYKNYKGKNMLLYFFLKFKIPYKFYDFKNRILYNYK